MRSTKVGTVRKVGIRFGMAGVVAAIGAVVIGVGPVSSGTTAITDTAHAESTPALSATDVVATESVTVPVRPEPVALTRPVVVLYGDSLSWEAREQFTAAFAGHPEAQVVTRTFGGTAICDWLDSMRADAASLAPGAVVIEFSGNALTACMQDATGQALSGDAYLARYRADAEAAVGIFEPIGTRVYFAGAPIPRPTDAPGAFKGGQLNAMYGEVADGHTTVAEFVDAGAAVLDQGRWTNTLPCLPGEPCTGLGDAAGQAVNVVRAPDGNHFCPVAKAARAGVTDTCPVWSSGAFRFGRAMAAPVLEALGA